MSTDSDSTDEAVGRHVPLLELLEIQPVETGEGKAVFEMVVDDRHLRTLGILHGGVTATLLDTAMGPLAGLLAGIIADRSGVSAALFTIGVICFGIVALVAVTYPKIRNI